MAPEGSFIYAEDFKSGKELAAEMLRVKNDQKIVSSYYQWHRQYGKVVYHYGKLGFNNLCKRLFAEDSTGCRSNSIGKPFLSYDICLPPYKTLQNLQTPFGTCHDPTMVH